jgi:mRNA-degrading endonuclease RelE of RelBE toxin-antitoxin system
MTIHASGAKELFYVNESDIYIYLCCLPPKRRTQLIAEIEQVIYYSINDKRIKQEGKTAWRVKITKYRVQK